MKKNILLKSITFTFMLLLSVTMLVAQSKEEDESAEQQAIIEKEMKAKKEMLNSRSSR